LHVWGTWQGRRGDPLGGFAVSHVDQRDAVRYWKQLAGLPNTSQAISIGTKIIIWPWTFMVLNCTVFPLDVWTDIICDVFAFAVIGASNAVAVSKERESLSIRIFTFLEDFFAYQAEVITGNSQRDTDFRSGHHVAVMKHAPMSSTDQGGGKRR
jgi:hypothetical protein